MIIKAFKTPKISKKLALGPLIAKVIKEIPEDAVLAITSKIVAIAEGRVVDKNKISKDELVKQEADYYLPRSMSQYDFCLSIKNHTLIASAGIDESNVSNQYVLWPENPQQSANQIRDFLLKKFKLKHLGIIITDSHVLPLRWGTQGTCVAHSGFRALNNYVGKPDIFGNPLKVTRANVAEGLAAAAVLAMGEGNEQTPLALITDLKQINFQSSHPSKKELDMLKIELAEDFFAPLLTNVKWQKNKL